MKLFKFGSIRNNIGCFRRITSLTGNGNILNGPIIWPVEKSYVQITGVDSRKLLQGLCTNDAINNLKRLYGSCIAAAFLTPKGRIFADVLVINAKKIGLQDSDDDNILIEADKDISKQLFQHLSMYKLRSKVNINERNDIKGYRAYMIDSSVNFDMPVEFTDENTLTFDDPRCATLGKRIICTSKENEKDIFDTTKCNHSIESSFRYINGVAEGKELMNKIPLECNLDLLQYIAFKKGCYIGQELTARTKFKGLVRKRIVPFLTVHPNIFRVNNNYPLSSEITQFSCLELRTKNALLELMIRDSKNDPRNDSIQKYLSEECQKSFKNYYSVPDSDPIKLHKITYPEDSNSEAIGEIICIDSHGLVGLAMIRLSELNSVNNNQEHIKFKACLSDDTGKSLSGSDFSIYPFKPDWWLDEDPVTGKKVIE